VVRLGVPAGREHGVLTKSGPNDAWLKSLTDWLEEHEAEYGAALVVEIPARLLSPASARLMEALGVEVQIVDEEA